VLGRWAACAGPSIAVGVDIHKGSRWRAARSVVSAPSATSERRLYGALTAIGANPRLLRLPWGYELFDRDPNQELRRTLCAGRSGFRSLRVAEAPQRADGNGVARGRRRAVQVPRRDFDRREGQDPRYPRFGCHVIPALPGAGAALFPPLVLPTLPRVRQLEQVLAAAIVAHDHSYIERPCVRRRIIDVDTRSIGIIEFSANQGQEAATCARCCAPSPSAGGRGDDDAGRSRRRARARGQGVQAQEQTRALTSEGSAGLVAARLPW
jgi:hypothetical protein